MAQGPIVSVLIHVSQCSDALGVVPDPEAELVTSFFVKDRLNQKLREISVPLYLQDHRLPSGSAHLADQLFLSRHRGAVGRHNVIAGMENIFRRVRKASVGLFHGPGPHHKNSTGLHVDSHRRPASVHSGPWNHCHIHIFYGNHAQEAIPDLHFSGWDIGGRLAVRLQKFLLHKGKTDQSAGALSLRNQILIRYTTGKKNKGKGRNSYQERQCKEQPAFFSESIHDLHILSFHVKKDVP